MISSNDYYLNAMEIDQWVERPVDCVKKLKELAVTVSQCESCILSKTRSQTVFARGNPKASLMIIGEAPGFYEDKQGTPFVGRAGQLLNAMLASVGLSEQEVYIANIIKCRPPDNRNPSVEEISQCRPYLIQQIDWVAPKFILALGKFAGEWLAGKKETLANMRQVINYYQAIPFMVSYHPAYLLRRPLEKKKSYLDLLFMMQRLNNL